MSPRVITDMTALEILYRADVLGHRLKDIARDLGIAPGTVSRCAADIRREMRDDNGTGNGTMPDRWWDTPRKDDE